MSRLSLLRAVVALNCVVLVASLGCGGGSAGPGGGASGGGSGSSSGSAAKTLVYGRGGDANTLDPINTDIGEAVKVIVNVFDTLVQYDQEKLDLVPGLAEKWEHSEDGLNWTFHLRSGAKFHDGSAVDADAVVYSFERMIQEKHPDVYDPARPYQPHYLMIDKVVAKDAATVEFTLKQPSAVF